MKIRLLPLLLIASACGEPETETGFAFLAHPGPWQIPPSTLASGDLQYVPYTSAGPWRGEEGCGGRLLDGTRVVRDFLYSSFPQIWHIGGYACRRNTGNESQMSVHGTGRALDIHIELDSGDADNDLGDSVGNWLIENAEAIGIQYIIWDRWTWGAARTVGEKGRAYGGPHPHDDHLHVELSVDAAAMDTPWFSSEMPPPPLNGCGAVAEHGTIVDDTSDCFTAYGPSEFWRDVEGRGYGDGLIWTNAFENDRPSNWARWRLDFDTPGRFEVAVFVDEELGVHSDTRYAVTSSGTETIVRVDQSERAGWIELGIFDFDAGAGQAIEVYDNARTEVPADQHIVVDAVRVAPLRNEPIVEPLIDERLEIDDPDVGIRRPPSIIGPNDPSPPSEPIEVIEQEAEPPESCQTAPGTSVWALLLLIPLLRTRPRS